MGFSGGYIFDGQAWLEFEPSPGTAPEVASPWLKVVIFDSDLADISYHPAGPGTGVAYLDDADASVEAKLARLFAAIGLPLPDGLTD